MLQHILAHFVIRSALADGSEHFIRENQSVAREGFAIGQNLVVCHGNRPGVEIRAQLEVIGFAAKHEVGLLQDLHRLIAISHAPKNVPVKPLLTLRQLENKLIGQIHYQTGHAPC